MATYKEPRYLHVVDHGAFDELHQPGMPAPFPGIYRCESCGNEVASRRGEPLPPLSHHLHEGKARPIRWRLIVFSETRGVNG